MAERLLFPLGNPLGLTTALANLIPSGSIFANARDWRRPGLPATFPAPTGWNDSTRSYNNVYDLGLTSHPFVTTLEPLVGASNNFLEAVDQKAVDLTSWLNDNGANIQRKVSRSLSDIPFSSPSSRSTRIPAEAPRGSSTRGRR